MGVKPVAPAPGMEAQLAEEVSTFSVSGETGLLPGVDTVEGFQDSIHRSLPQIVRNVHQASISGREVTPLANEAYKIYEELNNDPNKKLTAQETAIVWAAYEQAKEGLADKESLFYIQDATERQNIQDNLEGIQASIEIYLTQSEDDPTHQPNQERWRRIKGIPIPFWSETIPGAAIPGAQTAEQKARASFRPRQEIVQIRSEIANESFGKTYSRLNAEQKRQANELSYEEFYIRYGSERAEDMLDNLGQEYLDLPQNVIAEAKRNGNLQERELAQLAERFEDLCEKVTRERAKIRQMSEIVELQQFLGLDPSDPELAAVLTPAELVEAAIEYYEITTNPNDYRNDPDKLVKEYLRQKPLDLGVFMGHVYDRKLREYARSHAIEIPEQLKKPPTELSDEAKGNLSKEDAAFVLMKHLQNEGVDSIQDPVGMLVDRLGIDETTAKKYVEEAIDAGYMTNLQGNRPNPGENIRTNIDTIAEWGTPEMWSEAIRSGLIDETTLEAQLDVALQTQFPDPNLRAAEVQTRMKKVRKLNAAFDDTQPVHVRKDAVSRWSTKDLALNLLMTSTLLTPILAYMSEDDRKNLASQYA